MPPKWSHILADESSKPNRMCLDEFIYGTKVFHYNKGMNTDTRPTYSAVVQKVWISRQKFVNGFSFRSVEEVRKWLNYRLRENVIIILPQSY